MKKTIILSVFMLCISGVMYSQFSDFSLSDFKLPVIKRQRLDMHLNLDMNNSLQKYHSEGYDPAKFNHLRLANTDNIVYGLYKNTENLQSEQTYELNIEPSWIKDKSNTATNTSFELNNHLSISSINRKYFGNQRFFEPDIDFSATYYNENIKSETAGENDKTITASASIGIPLLIGKGRIEQVQDARLAIYILEDLQKHNRLSRIPDKTEILEFASFIATLKNERYFDYRLRRIEEIEKIDSFMQAKNWITKPDAAYFTSVYDNWEYADGPIRTSGKRISAGIEPGFSISQYHETIDYDTEPDDESNSQATQGGVSALLRYVSDKPVNLYWQRNWNAEVSYLFGKTWNNEKIADTKFNYNQNYIQGSLNYSLGYYPNSRTYLDASLGLDATIMFSEYTGDYYLDKAKGYVVSPNFNLDMYYYVSPQLRLTLYYTAQYGYSNLDRTYDPDNTQYQKTNTLYQNLNIAFTYSFF